MTLEDILAAQPESLSWPPGGVDGGGALGLPDMAGAIGPHILFPGLVAAPAVPGYLVNSDAEPWRCNHVVIPREPSRCVSKPAAVATTTVVRAAVASPVPPQRGAVVIGRR